MSKSEIEALSRPQSRLEKGHGARRAKVAQALMMQAGLAVILLGLAYIARAEPRPMTLYLATLIVPLGWGYTFWSAHTREEAARREGVWSKDWDKVDRKKTMGMLGGIIVAWVALAVVILIFL